MSDATQILSQMDQGDLSAADQLLPLVYEELRRLAAQKMTQETPGHSLTATALVHEVYLRLVDHDKAQHWNSRGHFFCAAAEAMRRILVGSARRKRSLKRGGGKSRIELTKLNGNQMARIRTQTFWPSMSARRSGRRDSQSSVGSVEVFRRFFNGRRRRCAWHLSCNRLSILDLR